MGLWVPTQGPRWAFWCPANGWASACCLCHGTPPLVFSRPVCLPLSPRDQCVGLSGQLRGHQMAFGCLPRTSISLCVLPKALCLPLGAALGSRCALCRSPEPSGCLSMPTPSPWRASGYPPRPSVCPWVPPRALPLPFSMPGELLLSSCPLQPGWSPAGALPEPHV